MNREKPLGLSSQVTQFLGVSIKVRRPRAVECGLSDNSPSPSSGQENSVEELAVLWFCSGMLEQSER